MVEQAKKKLAYLLAVKALKIHDADLAKKHYPEEYLRHVDHYEFADLIPELHITEPAEKLKKIQKPLVAIGWSPKARKLIHPHDIATLSLDLPIDPSFENIDYLTDERSF